MLSCIFVLGKSIYVLTHTSCRQNEYDGVEEFWVKTRETGKRKQQSTYEECTKQQREARAGFGMYIRALMRV